MGQCEYCNANEATLEAHVCEKCLTYFRKVQNKSSLRYEQIVNDIKASNRHEAYDLASQFETEAKILLQKVGALRLQLSRFEPATSQATNPTKLGNPITSDPLGVDFKTKNLLTAALRKMGMKFEVIATTRNRFKIYEVLS